MKSSNSKRHGVIGEKKPRKSLMHTSERGTLPSPAYPVILIWEAISLAAATIVVIIGLWVLLHISGSMPGTRTDSAKDVTDTWAGITQNIAGD